MSLEQALAENTAVMKQLITVMQSAAHGAESEAKPARAKKTEAATPAVPTPSAPVTLGGDTNDAAGNPIGTLYFDVAAHNTVYAVRPGDHNPTVAGAVQVADTQYLTLKAKYAANFNLPPAASAAPAAPAPAATPTTVATAPTAPAPAAPASAGSAEPTFVDVVAKFKELIGLAGNPPMAKILAVYKATKLTELNGKVACAELIAAAQAEIDSHKMLGA
jgi:hypothetical protein